MMINGKHVCVSSFTFVYTVSLSFFHIWVYFLEVDSLFEPAVEREVDIHTGSSVGSQLCI